MGQRTIQSLVLLAVFALAIHLGCTLFFDNYTTFDWGSERDRYTAGGSSVRGNAGALPKLSCVSSRPNTLPADVLKRDAVVDAFKWGWTANERDAIGSDEYHPLSRCGSNLSSFGGIGYTVVDALDTMLLMGLDTEYARACKWVAEELSLDRGYYSTFETTIRVLGGLLSAHYLTGDPLFLQHAIDLGDRLLSAFDTRSGLPAPYVNLGAYAGAYDSGGLGGGIAEATTLQLEFKYLAELTGRVVFWRKAEKVMEVVNRDQARIPNGLAPPMLRCRGRQVCALDGSDGGSGDSYYEYLLKQYLQTNQTEPVYLQMYTDAMTGVHEHLVRRSANQGLAYLVELLPRGGEDEWTSSWDTLHQQEHLACFLPGSLMLGATTVHALHQRPHATPHGGGVSVPPRMEELTATGRRDWEMGMGLLEGCLDTLKTETGLAPESVHFRTSADPAGERDWYIPEANEEGFLLDDPQYMLCPEIAESIFLAYRLTADARYRALAWDIFNAIEGHCRLSGGGYATVLHVGRLPVEWDDKQETFLFGASAYLFF
ncbi:glycoside hydrolase [Mycena crocata]|nr:glycoside hydrolase [Mycena crocata]